VASALGLTRALTGWPHGPSFRRPFGRCGQV